MKYVVSILLFCRSLMAGEDPAVIDVTEEFLKARIVKRGELEFPLIHRATVPGRVVLSIRVDETGTVEYSNVMVGHPLLNDSAMRHMSSFRFDPYVRDGRKAKMSGYFTVSYDFGQSPIYGRDIGPLRILKNGLAVVNGKEMQWSEVLRWLESERFREHERIIHIVISDRNQSVDAVLKRLELQRGLTVVFRIEE